MRRPTIDLLLVAAASALTLIAALLLASRLARHRAALSAERASWSLTPGALNAAVSQGSIGSTICVRGWTRTIRPSSSYTRQLELEQMRAYGRTGSPSDYQEDHLISLELGGDPTDPRNLWPEPRERAEEVDRTEDELRERVCSGRLSLAEAQRRISAIKHSAG